MLLLPWGGQGTEGLVGAHRNRRGGEGRGEAARRGGGGRKSRNTERETRRQRWGEEGRR